MRYVMLHPFLSSSITNLISGSALPRPMRSTKTRDDIGDGTLPLMHELLCRMLQPGTSLISSDSTSPPFETFPSPLQAPVLSVRMEGVAAFSLACNVIQITELSRKVIRTAREIQSSRNGTTSEHENLQATATSLRRDLDIL
jgi:hypothetical protein